MSQNKKRENFYTIVKFTIYEYYCDPQVKGILTVQNLLFITFH